MKLRPLLLLSALLCLAALSPLCAAPAPTTPGSLDTGFATRGKSITTVGGNVLHGYRVAIQNDGKILVAFSMINSRTRVGVIAVMRLLATGKVDRTFGVRGTAKAVQQQQGTVFPAALRILGDGSILVGGTAADFAFTEAEWVVARLNAQGALDGAFGINGVYRSNLGPGPDRLSGMDVDSTGRIVLSGTRQPDFMTGGHAQLALQKLAAAGQLDGMFGTAGTRIRSLGTGDTYTNGGAVRLSDDAIYVAADTVDGMTFQTTGLLARFTSNGDLDTTYNTTGIVSLGANNSLRSLALFNGGVLGGGVHFDPMTGNQDFLLARGFDNGSPDAMFGTNGVSITPLSAANDILIGIAIQGDGKPVACGTVNVNTESDLILARYTATGALDATFGTGGVFQLNVGRTGRTGSHDAAYGLAIQTDGKIVTAGRTSSGSRTPAVSKLLVTRHLP